MKRADHPRGEPIRARAISLYLVSLHPVRSRAAFAAAPA